MTESLAPFFDQKPRKPLKKKLKKKLKKTTKKLRKRFDPIDYLPLFFCVAVTIFTSGDRVFRAHMIVSYLAIFFVQLSKDGFK